MHTNRQTKYTMLNVIIESGTIFSARSSVSNRRCSSLLGNSPCKRQYSVEISEMKEKQMRNQNDALNMNGNANGFVHSICVLENMIQMTLIRLCIRRVRRSETVTQFSELASSAQWRQCGWLVLEMVLAIHTIVLAYIEFRITSIFMQKGSRHHRFCSGGKLGHQWRQCFMCSCKENSVSNASHLVASHVVEIKFTHSCGIKSKIVWMGWMKVVYFLRYWEKKCRQFFKELENSWYCCLWKYHISATNRLMPIHLSDKNEAFRNAATLERSTELKTCSMKICNLSNGWNSIRLLIFPPLAYFFKGVTRWERLLHKNRIYRHYRPLLEQWNFKQKKET